MKSWLEKNAIEMYSTYNGGKSIAAERFIRNLALFRMGLFGPAHGWDGAKSPPSLKSATIILQ